MFVISVKSDKVFKLALAAILTVVLTIGAAISVSRQNALPASNIGGIVMKGETAEERIAFFSQFGWEISEDPLEVKEVVIPEEFDETYEEYNDIQKQQNLDLEKYKGARVKMWSYEIKNYPGYENTDGIIRGNILVYEGVIVGGDICSTELGGFMHTFDKPQTSQTILTESSP